MFKYVYPTIVVPGITASYLHDTYALPPEIVWSVMKKEYERAVLHPDDLRYEAAEPARVVPGQLFEVAYRELIEELRYNLREKEDLPVPVFPFSYDWRQPIEATETQLGLFIEEVIARTKLLRHYDRAEYGKDPKVNLVGHSMGGLVIAGYLARAGKDHPVHKVATLATPFQGSFEAVIKITTGTANLGQEAPSSREREAARLTPALYQLLPSYPKGLEVEEGLPRTLFDPKIWQTSILDTIEEFIRLHGLDKKDRPTQARELFADLLKTAKQHRARIDGLKLDAVGLSPAEWLCVIGVDADTRVKLKVETFRNAPVFNITSADRHNNWSNGEPQAQRLTGDGTVPFEGAVPKFLPLESLVCIRPKDFGYWELQDRGLTRFAGFHGILPNMDMLHRLVVAHLKGITPRHDNAWGRPAPGVVKWDPPVKGLKNKAEDETDESQAA